MAWYSLPSLEKTLAYKGDFRVLNIQATVLKLSWLELTRIVAKNLQSCQSSFSWRARESGAALGLVNQALDKEGCGQNKRPEGGVCMGIGHYSSRWRTKHVLKGAQHQVSAPTFAIPPPWSTKRMESPHGKWRIP